MLTGLITDDLALTHVYDGGPMIQSLVSMNLIFLEHVRCVTGSDCDVADSWASER